MAEDPRPLMAQRGADEMRLFRIKRVAVTLSAWGVLALYIHSVAAQSPPSSGSPAQRPNIVLILTDDLDSRSIARLQKLNLLLTDRGTTFANFFVSDSPSFDEADILDKPAWLSSQPPLAEHEIARIDQAYRRRLQSMLAVEDLIASLLESLQAAGKLDNTYIFFTSDNGYHLGQHRLLPGKQTPYEEDIRVPLIVRGPGVREGAVVNELAGNIDLAPTFAELAGIDINPSVDGRSLAPLLTGDLPPGSAWRRAFLLEHTRQEEGHDRRGL
ncbi:MAG: hypothetical protein DMF49_12650 [Acidobacteria bacterium]|nr:MAG: hypothetical protein DMF49_12650 [Acidobacteriota bacterium]